MKKIFIPLISLLMPFVAAFGHEDGICAGSAALTFSDNKAEININTPLMDFKKGKKITVNTTVTDPMKKTVAKKSDTYKFIPGLSACQNITIDSLILWSPETPVFYTAFTEVSVKGKAVDSCRYTFAMRSARLSDNGCIELNGYYRIPKGVLMNNIPSITKTDMAELHRRLVSIKSFGADMIRLPYGKPDDILLEICDELGLMVMVEPEFAESLQRHPSVVGISSANGIPGKWIDDFTDRNSLIPSDILDKIRKQWNAAGKPVPVKDPVKTLPPAEIQIHEEKIPGHLRYQE